MFASMIQSLWRSIFGKGGVEFECLNDQVFQRSGKHPNPLMSLTEIEWWRYDDAQQMTVVACANDRRLLVIEWWRYDDAQQMTVVACANDRRLLVKDGSRRLSDLLARVSPEKGRR
jgi:hypothetical protein